jgi:NADH-quinone oxidoreductase subunit K
LALVAFSRAWVNNAGHIFVFLVVTVAAAEAAIALAIVVAVFRRAKNVDLDEVAGMHG